MFLRKLRTKRKYWEQNIQWTWPAFFDVDPPSYEQLRSDHARDIESSELKDLLTIPHDDWKIEVRKRDAAPVPLTCSCPVICSSPVNAPHTIMRTTPPSPFFSCMSRHSPVGFEQRSHQCQRNSWTRKVQHTHTHTHAHAHTHLTHKANTKPTRIQHAHAYLLKATVLPPPHASIFPTASCSGCER